MALTLTLTLPLPLTLTLTLTLTLALPLSRHAAQLRPRARLHLATRAQVTLTLTLTLPLPLTLTLTLALTLALPLSRLAKAREAWADIIYLCRELVIKSVVALEFEVVCDISRYLCAG